MKQAEEESTCHALEKYDERILLLLWTGSILCFVAYGIQKAMTTRTTFSSELYSQSWFLRGLYTFVQERDSQSSWQDWRQMKPADVDVLRDGNRVQLSPDDLLVGDIIFIKAGDFIAADIRAVETTYLKIDQSSLTGEPDAIKKDPFQKPQKSS